MLDAAGSRRPMTKGEVLHRAGDRSSQFYVVLRGSLVGLEDFGCATEREIAVWDECRFSGELNLMTGQPAYLTAVAREDGEAIVLTRDQLKAVVARTSSSEISS